MMKLRTAYLYSRVSSALAAKNGDGLHRQQEKAKEWLINYPDYKLSDRHFIDAGKSGYHGENLDPEAGLGSFLRACDDGEIEQGSLLCVELVDRIGRLPPRQAKSLFNRILDYGVSVAIVKWNIIVNADDKSSDLSSDLLLTVGFHLAYMESKQKSERIKATHAKRRSIAANGGAKRTAVCPAWLTLSDDRQSFIPIPERVNTIKLIYKMKLEGDGANAITKKLNSLNIPTFTSRNNWSTTTINNYLRMSSVIGHFQAHNVSMIDGKKTYTKTGNLLKDYYPAIVSEDLFYRVQASFKKSTHGRKGNFTNLFRGLIICDKCNGTMSWASSPILTGGHHTYLRCRNFSIHRTCDKESVKYEPFEKHIIETLKHIDLSIYIQGNVDYRLEIQTKNNVVKNLEKQLTNYQLAIGESSPDAISGLIAQLEKVQGQIHDVHISIAELKSKTKETTGIKLKEAAHRLDTSSYISRKEFNNILSSYIEQVNPSNDHYTIKFIERDVPLTVIIAENREIDILEDTKRASS